MAYTLDLTHDDINTIAFVGARYCWSDVIPLIEGPQEIVEHEAWEMIEAFDRDTEGGHSMFPMLDHNSDLADKLIHFYGSVV